MTLVELKKFITDKVKPSDFMIFIDKDNKFLAKQYVEALGNLTTGGICKITSIYEPQHSSLSLLTAPEDCLNVLTVETFNEIAENYSDFENTIVVCEQIDKSIDSLVENFVIKMPKLEEWQILDYIKTLCPEIDETEASWLIKSSNGSIEKLLNELDKITIFPKNERKQILSEVLFSSQTDLYNVDLFTIVNALVDGDLAVLFNFLKYQNYDILEPVVLANRTLSSLKNILIITQNPTLSAEECGVSVAQYNTLKYKYRSLNVEAVKQKIKFLANFDLMLKTSKLEMSKQDMLNYLVVNLSNRII